MSRKLVNVLTFLSIVIGEIYLLYISILTIHDIKKYNISAIQIAIIIFIFFFPAVISYIRYETIMGDDFVPDKNNIKVFIKMFLFFFALATFIYILSIKNITDNTTTLTKYTIIRKYISIVFLNIFYIISHFFNGY